MSVAVLSKADHTAALNLLLTQVAGQSPYQELLVDFGSLWGLDPTLTGAALKQACTAALQNINNNITNGSMAAVGVWDAQNVLRGWSLFIKGNGAGLYHVSPVSVAWECDLVVTDKSLPLATRLDGARQLLLWGAQQAVDPDTTYVWGDVKANGNLDQFLSAHAFHVIAARPDGSPILKGTTVCNRYYASATDVMGQFA